MVFYRAMTKNNDKKIPTTVGIVPLGCPKNMVDSERILAELAQTDFAITADYNEADIVIVNTCGFIEPAKQESLGIIADLVELKKQQKIKKIIVAGCLAERLGKELFDCVDGIDAIVGLAERDNIAKIARQVINSDNCCSFMAEKNQIVADDRVRLRITPQHWSYLRISEGCNHKCSFCTIPAIRGRFQSKKQSIILQEAEELAESGVKELNIIAQDTAYYGKDIALKDGLSQLLTKLEKIASIDWIRVMYLYPLGITDRLINTIKKSDKILHYIDMPVQHINNKILKDMYRPDTKEQIYQLIEKLKEQIDGLVLRTTIIVGFPGETDEQFQELLDFVKWAQFDALGAFTYYAEQGTDAAEMKNQVPDEIKQQRLDKLMLAQQEIVFEKNKNKVGSELLCLVDSVDQQKCGTARYYGQAPEIDSVCIINDCNAVAGEFIKTKVTDYDNYDLIVEQI